MTMARMWRDLVARERQRALMSVIADSSSTRDTVARLYAEGLARPEDINWTQVNYAILDRWGDSALTYIKERAWAMYERDS